jgi:hypothetical protein
VGNEWFVFGGGAHQHHKGDPECAGCRWDRPSRCECGGLIHIEYADNQVTPFTYFCDRCSKRKAKSFEI